MNSVEDGATPEKAPASEEVDANAQDTPLTPPKESGFSGDLLDELFSSDDPRLQSGIASGDSDDDIDFIRMSGLTSPEVPSEVDGLSEVPDLLDTVTPDPVSFYEPGVADVDASMTPENPQPAANAAATEFLGSEPIPESEPPVVDPVEDASEAVLDSLSDSGSDSELTGGSPSDAPETPAESWDAESRIAKALEALDSASSGQVESDFDPMLEPAPQTHVPEFVEEQEFSESVEAVKDVVGPDMDSPGGSGDAEEPAFEALPDSEPEPAAPINSGSIAFIDEDSADSDGAESLPSAQAEPTDETNAVPESENEIIDLDSLEDDDEVFSDLSVPPTVESAPVEPVEDDVAPVELEQTTEPEPTSLEPVELDEDDAGPVEPEQAAEPVPVELVEDDTAALEPEPVASEPVEDVEDPSPFVDDSEPEDALPDAPDGEESATLDDSTLDDKLAGAANTDDEEVLAEVPAAEITDPYEGPATVQTFGRRSSRHHRRHQSTLPRLVKAATVLIVFGAVLAYGGYEAYRWFEIQVSNPTTLYYEAESAAAMGRNLQSSRLFEEFARRNPDHPLAADAMFAAGYQMQQVETEDSELTQQYDEESLALLDEFLRRHPDHERAGRAQSLIGFVHYRKGDYRAAIDAFIDRDAILRDPAATLPMLRTLARSYAHVGEYEAAHTTYIRAANSPGNASPDEDYDELGEMYRALAQSADTPDAHEVYQELALEHWSHAMRYPGINPTRKNAIRVKVDLLGDLGKIDGTPMAIEVRPSETGVVVPVRGEEAISPTAFEAVAPLPFDTVPARAETPEAEPELESGNVPVETPSEAPAEATDEGIRRSVADPPSPEYHEIAPGDQLSRIAQQYGISSDDLMKWNGIENADHIEIGQRLVLHEPPAPAT